MAKYIAGLSVLQIPGRDPVQPGEVFDYVFPPLQEEHLLACGAITRQPPEPEVQIDAPSAEVVPAEPVAETPAAPATGADEAPADGESGSRSVPASRRRKEQKE